MGRFKQNYSLYPRKMSSGSIVYYYRTYDTQGERTTGRSTHQTSITKARLYCESLLKKGELNSTNILLSAYSKDLFIKGGRYETKIKHGNITYRTLSAYDIVLKKYIIPHFKGKRISDIRKKDVLDFVENGIKDFSKSYKSIIIAALKGIFALAVLDEIITVNPADNIISSYGESKQRDAFNLDEVKAILNGNWNKAMNKDIFFIAILTGMRIAEIRAIRDETLFDDYILVKDQFVSGVYCPTKTKKLRYVPICPEVHDFIKKVIHSYNITALESLNINRPLKIIMSTCIPDASDRLLSFHSCRHFYNTYLCSKLPGTENKIASVLGHAVGVSSTQGRYTNFKASDFTEIIQAQKLLWNELH